MGYIMNLREIVGHSPLIGVGATTLVFNNKNELLLNLRSDTNTWGIPGGSLELFETIEETAIRELKEETGTNYFIDEFTYLCTINYYQKNYPKRNGKFKNRLLTTHYYVGKYKGLSMQSLTESEKTGNFKLELIPLDKLEELIANNRNDNPRNMYFIKELVTVLKYYNDNPNKRMILNK